MAPSKKISSSLRQKRNTSRILQNGLLFRENCKRTYVTQVMRKCSRKRCLSKSFNEKEKTNRAKCRYELILITRPIFEKTTRVCLCCNFQLKIAIQEDSSIFLRNSNKRLNLINS